jgi:hypothetical protein
VRWVVAFSPWVRSAHTVTAAISHSHSSLDGHLSRRKTGGPTLRPNGAKLVQMIVSVFPFPVVHTAVSLMFSVTPQWDGYIQMMRGSSHIVRRWVSGRLKVR